jgi:hypothetical protein
MSCYPDPDEIVRLYQSGIDYLLDGYSKPIMLYFKETIGPVNEEFHDKVRPGEIKKPIYKATEENSYPSVADNTLTITGFIKHNPKDFANYGINVKDAKDVMRLKHYIRFTPDILRCDYCIPSQNTKELVYAKYKLLRPPFPIGLRDEKYAISFWERV